MPAALAGFQPALRTGSKSNPESDCAPLSSSPSTPIVATPPAGAGRLVPKMRSQMLSNWPKLLFWSAMSREWWTRCHSGVAIQRAARRSSSGLNGHWHAGRTPPGSQASRAAPRSRSAHRQRSIRSRSARWPRPTRPDGCAPPSSHRATGRCDGHGAIATATRCGDAGGGASTRGSRLRR